MSSVLIIEDEDVLAANIATYLTRNGFSADIAHTAREGLAAIEHTGYEVLILDYNLPDLNGLEVLTRVSKLDPSMATIMVTGEGNIQIAVNAMKAGAFDYLTKPLVLKELKVLLEKAASQQRLTNYLDYHHKRASTLGRLKNISGTSAAVEQFRLTISKIVNADMQAGGNALASVLITGETGTGKELAAKALHFDGPRAKHPFVEINCAAIPAELLEAELFGFEKGAFTGASARRKGLVESADGGTLFVDEIGDMPIALQAKLLKVLEEGSIRRLGDNRERIVDVRIISATHQDLEKLIAEKRFRHDLFYRLCVISLKPPPLRERGNDIVELAQLFLAEFSVKYNKPDISLGASAQARLMTHPWPGNIRELRNCIEQATLMSTSAQLQGDDLWLPGASVTAQDTTILPFEGLSLDELEQELIRQALARTDGNVTRAAELLGLSRDQLRYRIKK